jgi:hypothetical protein
MVCVNVDDKIESQRGFSISHHIKKCTECFPISCIMYEKCPVYWFNSGGEIEGKFDVLNANIYRIWLFHFTSLTQSFIEIDKEYAEILSRDGNWINLKRFFNFWKPYNLRFFQIFTEKINKFYFLFSYSSSTQNSLVNFEKN